MRCVDYFLLPVSEPLLFCFSSFRLFPISYFFSLHIPLVSSALAVCIISFYPMFLVLLSHAFMLRRAGFLSVIDFCSLSAFFDFLTRFSFFFVYTSFR